jgi:hypothetical protein
MQEYPEQERLTLFQATLFVWVVYATTHGRVGVWLAEFSEVGTQPITAVFVMELET